ncbi:sorbitol dehydrogenase family protein [Larsenimonas rhizosphaerae]|uniref:Sorbitol dehydrogenase family protein n=1 Tax=Larsenimonas rhizosphaerae TaxID=2944682 RepID=A0AA41ZG65_9GAMM|nr:sorbitol dehydrogenase family protein [Larsenimonas rhizosphaerae]MCM2132099.1 sorbitol dehydrogenase family protein [Larsenimonas rhizosphaerae]MCX2524702.1 sorbitol dehydrogenase family protein [Larsenimonas rhizosphaerae]
MTRKTISSRAFAVTRRQLLGATLAGAAGSAMMLSPFKAFAAQAGVPSLGVFMRLSQALCEKTALNPAVGQPLLKALLNAHDGFGDRLRSLADAVPEGQAVPVDGLNAEQRRTAKRILSAWYTGIVGEGDQARVVTYRHALQFKAVDDILVIRSYCPNEPGFWAVKPSGKRA